MAQRTQRRLQHSASFSRWRAFPFARNVKVWFNESESLATSLKLYQAYSKRARFAKLLSRSLPRVARNVLFRGRPPLHTELRLARLTHLIRTTLDNPALDVSFSTGTPGPHQKLTAQVTRADAVVCYVKIAHNEEIATLLQREADMLSWLHNSGFNAAQLPRVLSFVRDATQALLFLSAPVREPRRRGIDIDDDDAKFLVALARLNQGTVGVAQAQRDLAQDRGLAAVCRQHPTAGRTVQQAIAAIAQIAGLSGIRTHAYHGDYAPWNTWCLGNSKMLVFDWEYGAREAPALTDLFHRLFKPARLVKHERPRDAVDRLLQSPDAPVTCDIISHSGVPRTHVPAYVLLYLLGELARRAKPDEFLLESLCHTLNVTGLTPQRHKVLVAAYACEPGRGSEPGVGWRMCESISREHEAWVITRENNRTSIEEELSERPNPYLHFTYADLPAWARFWKRGRPGIRLYYYLWQFAALGQALKLKRKVDFALAHHVTFVNDYTFTFVALLGIPYVWGPVGSNDKSPFSLIAGKRALLQERAQYYVKTLLRWIDPLVWLSALRATLVIGINSRIGMRVPFTLLDRGKYRQHIAIGVEQQLTAYHLNRPRDGFRVISVGDFISIKAFHLSVRAFGVLIKAHPSARLTLIGDGPERPRLQALVASLGLQEFVNFVSWLPRAQALRRMGDADAFLFPSFEAAGMVVLEAMALGLPVICLRGGGASEMITSECGFVVDPSSLHATVEGLVAALTRLAGDPGLRRRMGATARRLVQEKYLWEERHHAIRQWYLAAGIVSTESRRVAPWHPLGDG